MSDLKSIIDDLLIISKSFLRLPQDTPDSEIFEGKIIDEPLTEYIEMRRSDNERMSDYYDEYVELYKKYGSLPIICSELLTAKPDNHSIRDAGEYIKYACTGIYEIMCPTFFDSQYVIVLASTHG